MTNAANFNDYSGDGVFGRDKGQLAEIKLQRSGPDDCLSGEA